MPAGSSDEGEPAGGGGGSESCAEMEENSSLRSSSSNSSGLERNGVNPIYHHHHHHHHREPKSLNSSAGTEDNLVLAEAAYREFAHVRPAHHHHQQLDYPRFFDEPPHQQRHGLDPRPHHRPNDEDDRKPWDFNDKAFQARNFLGRDYRDDYREYWAFAFCDIKIVPLDRGDFGL